MLSNPLSSLLVSEQDGVQGFVASWRARGASAVGITVDDVTRVIWSDHSAPTPSLRAPIEGDSATLGSVWITGVCDPVAQAQLSADATWLSTLAQREVELEDLTRELVETQDQLLALYDLNRSLGHHNTLQEALADLAAQTARMMKCGLSFALLIKTNAVPVIVQSPSEFCTAAKLCTWALKADNSGSAVVWRLDEVRAAGEPIRNSLVVSTRLRGGELVSIGWCNRNTDEFGSPEIKLGQALVEQAGARVESVLRHEASLAQVRINTEVELARSIQERLLPKQSLQLPDLDIAANTIPAFEMGGDFYDYAQVQGRPLMFCVGDVSGKGLSAATVMAAARAAVRTHSRYIGEPSPAAVLNRANEDLEDDLNSTGRFVTIFIGQFQPETSRLTFANAGHSPVLLKRAGESARMLEADAPPLGVLSILDCQDEGFDTRPGDLLVIATDGLPEATSATGEMFGYKRLIEAINLNADLPSAKIIENLLAQVREFGGEMPQSDDQTLLVVKRKPCEKPSAPNDL